MGGAGRLDSDPGSRRRRWSLQLEREPLRCRCLVPQGRVQGLWAQKCLLTCYIGLHTCTKARCSDPICDLDWSGSGWRSRLLLCPPSKIVSQMHCHFCHKEKLVRPPLVSQPQAPQRNPTSTAQLTVVLCSRVLRCVTAGICQTVVRWVMRQPAHGLWTAADLPEAIRYT